MPRSGLALLLMGLIGLVLGGCMHDGCAVVGASLTPGTGSCGPHALCAGSHSPRFRRHLVEYPRRETPGTILVDTDARYLYYVLPGGKAVRYA